MHVEEEFCFDSLNKNRRVLGMSKNPSLGNSLHFDEHVVNEDRKMVDRKLLESVHTKNPCEFLQNATSNCRKTCDEAGKMGVALKAHQLCPQRHSVSSPYK